MIKLTALKGLLAIALVGVGVGLAVSGISGVGYGLIAGGVLSAIGYVADQD